MSFNAATAHSAKATAAVQYIAVRQVLRQRRYARTAIETASATPVSPSSVMAMKNRSAAADLSPCATRRSQPLRQGVSRAIKLHERFIGNDAVQDGEKSPRRGEEHAG